MKANTHLGRATDRSSDRRTQLSPDGTCYAVVALHKHAELKIAHHSMGNKTHGKAHWVRTPTKETQDRGWWPKTFNTKSRAITTRKQHTAKGSYQNPQHNCNGGRLAGPPTNQQGARSIAATRYNSNHFRATRFCYLPGANFSAPISKRQYKKKKKVSGWPPSACTLACSFALVSTVSLRLLVSLARSPI